LCFLGIWGWWVIVCFRFWCFRIASAHERDMTARKVVPGSWGVGINPVFGVILLWPIWSWSLRIFKWWQMQNTQFWAGIL
jgi:hypothetical protein